MCLLKVNLAFPGWENSPTSFVLQFEKINSPSWKCIQEDAEGKKALALNHVYPAIEETRVEE